MHTYPNLNGRKTQQWADDFARRVGLVHSVRGMESIRNVTEHGRLEPKGDQKSENTRESENVLEEPPAVYFFAGRAHPDGAGNAAVVIGAGSEEHLDAMAAPFDTGGVIHGKSLLPCGSERGERAKYVREHSVCVGLFRDYFCLHLSAHFGAPEDYVPGPPTEEIDDVSFSSAPDKFYDWTFELRSFDDVETDGVSASVFVNPDAVQYMAERAADGADVTRHFEVARVPGSSAERVAQGGRNHE